MEISPNIRFGSPVIKGTRISVSDILQMFADGMTIDNIIYEFPQLKQEHIKACLSFVASKERQISIAV